MKQRGARRGPRGRRVARRSRIRRAIAITVFVTLIVQANGQAAVAVGSHVDAASPMALVGRLIDWVKGDPKPPRGPQQKSGTAAGKAHQVSADETRAEGGRGKGPGKGRKQLDRDDPHRRDFEKFGTGAGMRPGNGFDKNTGKRRADLTTATSETMQDSGGRLERTTSAGRMNYRKADGSFAAIDTDLKAEKGRFKQKGNDRSIEVAVGADDPELMTVGVGPNGSVSAGIKGANKSPAVIEGAQATYRNVMPSTDLELLTLESGVKETIVLNSTDAPTSWTFPLTLNDLTPRLNKGGDLEYLNADGEVVTTTPHGYMLDSKFDPKTGRGTFSDAVKYELVETKKGFELRVTVDRGWVRDPARTFPLRVDPSIVSSGDTWVYEGITLNRAADLTLSAGTWNGTNRARAFMAFSSLGNPPQGQHTTSATLNVNLAYQETCTAAAFDVVAIRSAWTPAGATSWSNMPSIGGTLGTASPAPGAACTNYAADPAVGTWVAIPLPASYFDAWSAGNFGLAIKGSGNEKNTASWKQLVLLGELDP